MLADMSISAGWIETLASVKGYRQVKGKHQNIVGRRREATEKNWWVYYKGNLTSLDDS